MRIVSRAGRRIGEAVKSCAWFIVQVVELGPSILLQFPARWLRRKTLTLRINRMGRVTVRPADSDLQTIVGVYVGGDYDLSRYPQHAKLKARYQAILAAGETPLIIDAGANIGVAARWFLALYPEAELLAVEPEGANAALCRRNLEGHPNARVVEAAIGGTPGAVAMVDGGAGSWAWQTERVERDGIRVVTIDQLLAEAGPGRRLFVAKIDIEGFEKDLFSRNIDWVQQPAAIFVEPHDWMLPGQGSSATMQAAILGQGFEVLALKETLVFVR